MKKYVLYGHDGSGNHGCEALVRSTIELFGLEPESVVLISARPEEDIAYHVDHLCRVIKKDAGCTPRKTSLEFLKAYYALRVKKNYILINDLSEKTVAGVKRGDVALSIGGDSYCYGDYLVDQLIRKHNSWKRSGLHTVYWGCSIEPVLLNNPKIVADIKAFDLITARESISYEALKKVNPNTILVSDAAFSLKALIKPLPEEFTNCDLVGINVSPLIEKKETILGITRKNYTNLIEEILNDTNMKILLIPHVVWDHDDDRIILQEFYQQYKETGRVYYVNECSCEELKGYIARCRYFIGARTHATIAAYSSFVPTIVVGYSVKAQGIAKDLLGTDERYVIPVQNLKTEMDLVNGFRYLEENEQTIKQKLQFIIPEYTQRVMRGVEAVKLL